MNNAFIFALSRIKKHIISYLLLINPLYRIEARMMRKNGTLINISELKPLFNKKKIFTFGTGGSISNLKNVNDLKKFNLLALTIGPLKFLEKYKFVPNLWVVHNHDSIEMFIKELDGKKIDFSKTFILVPSNDSESKIHFDSKIFRILRKKIKKTTYVLYKEKCFTEYEKIPKTYLKKNEEPLVMVFGTAVEGLILPICIYLKIKEIYFSGIDNLPTGHFWDVNRQYQDKYGKEIDFLNSVIYLKTTKIAKKIIQKLNIKIFRLEKKDTILKKSYPLIEFNAAKHKASPRINPKYYIKTNR